MVLETKRLLLREMNPDDYEALYAVLADPDIMQHYPSSTKALPKRGYATLCPHPLRDLISCIFMVKLIPQFLCQTDGSHILRVPARIQTFVQTSQDQRRAGDQRQMLSPFLFHGVDLDLSIPSL